MMTTCSLIVRLLFYSLFILFGALLIKIPTIALREYDTMLADCWQNKNQSPSNENGIHIIEGMLFTDDENDDDEIQVSIIESNLKATKRCRQEMLDHLRFDIGLSCMLMTLLLAILLLSIRLYSKLFCWPHSGMLESETFITFSNVDKKAKMKENYQYIMP
nr:uncharacterized protein LOC124496275 [Dermatophagoides farinae]